MATWANDALDAEPPRGKAKPASDYLNFDSDDSDSGQESEEEPARKEPEGEGASVLHTGLCLASGCVSQWERGSQELSCSCLGSERHLQMGLPGRGWHLLSLPGTLST